MFTTEGSRKQLYGFARIWEEKSLPALRRLDGFEVLLVSWLTTTTARYR